MLADQSTAASVGTSYRFSSLSNQDEDDQGTDGGFEFVNEGHEDLGPSSSAIVQDMVDRNRRAEADTEMARQSMVNRAHEANCGHAYRGKEVPSNERLPVVSFSRKAGATYYLTPLFCRKCDFCFYCNEDEELTKCKSCNKVDGTFDGCGTRQAATLGKPEW